MKLAIVGTSNIYTDWEERDIRQLISAILYNEKPDLVISGTATGVDTIAIEVAKGLGYETRELAPGAPNWNEFKKRNIKIARECDKLICISIPVHKQKCYHHNPLGNHEKTAGCWTLNQAKLLGKEVKFLMNRPEE